MVWVDLFRAFLSICGLAVSLFVVIQLWRAVPRMRRDMPPMSPEQRRENWIAALGTLGGMVVASAAIYGAYTWGSAQWDTRTGAALAIGAFMVATMVFYICMFVLARRDARRDREQQSVADDHHGS